MRIPLRLGGLLLLLPLATFTFRAAQKSGTPNRREAIRLNNLGVAYLDQQNPEAALKAFQQAFALDPDLYAARLNQGIALLNLQNTEAARDLLLEAARKQPDNSRTWYNLGLAYQTLGQREAALEAFTRVAQWDANDADTQYFLGLTYSQLQDYERAVSAYRRALELAPFHASAQFGLAQAYLRAGQAELARQHLARFEKWTREKIAAPMSLNYGDRGKYALAEEVRQPGVRPPPPIPVRFVPVPDGAGIRFAQAASPHAETLAPFLGSGACFLDFDNDGWQDVFVAGSGTDAAGALYRNVGGRFVDVTRSARLNIRGPAMACTAGDYDNDGRTDLAISLAGRVVLLHNEGNGTFRDVTEAAGLKAEGLFLGLTFVDYDHDGDLDLYATRFEDFPWKPGRPFDFPMDSSKGRNILWRNNGNGTFTDWTVPSGLAGNNASVAATLTDFNNDRAVDLVVTGWAKAPTVFVNPREGPFVARQPWGKPMPAPTAGVIAFDFDKDGFMDLAFTHWGPPGLTVWRNVEGKSFEPVPLPPLNWQRGWGLAALDYDNDGWVDLAAVGEVGDRGSVVLLRNEGPAGFADVTKTTGLDSVSLTRPRGIIAVDYDADGGTDLLITQNGGPVELLRNEGGNRNHRLRIALKGLADNKSAVGTKMEVFAGPLWQKWELPAASGYLTQGPLEVSAGLGSEQQADIVRLLWPTGVLQDEVQLAGGKPHNLAEIDRRGSSCPVLFAWNGSRYEFVSDLIGAGVIGHWVGPHERNVPDPTEYIKVEGRRVVPRQGRLSFRFAEPMEEVIYLDQARLLAVDHPGELEVYPNERFVTSGPPPEFKVIRSRRPHPPAGARDGNGRNVLPELLHRDGRYVGGFRLLPFQGLAELHRLELDLPRWDVSVPLRLLLHGFIEYFTATSAAAAYQAGVSAVPPYMEAMDRDGRWVRVMDDMGFPAGLPRTMVVDLTGRLPAGSRRIRIITNLQIYWDQILVDDAPQDAPVRLSEVPLAEARLSFRGYPRMVEGRPRGNIRFLYDEVSLTGPYAHQAGGYTRYGDVKPLLEAADDRFVIFGSGEELALEFDPASLPPLPAGWSRDYFFFADGFTKDMDFYSAESLTVEPLPFHRMLRYPYPGTGGYPSDDLHLAYRLNYNARAVSEKGHGSYRFEYRHPSRP